MLPVIKVPPIYPGQWGIVGSDSPLGIRTLPGAKVFHVSSTHALASNDNDGTNPDYPKAQLAAAITAAVAGDWIILAPGHAETLATAGAVTFNKAGLHVVGVGEGAYRPTFTMSAVASSVVFSSPNCHLENALFVSGAANSIVLDVNTTNTILVNVEVREGAAATFVLGIDITGAGANAGDRTKVLACKIISAMVGATSGINVGAVQEGLLLQQNWIQGDFTGAGIVSGSVLTNALVAENHVANMHAGEFAIEFSAAATGFIVENHLYTNAIATCLDPGSMKCVDNMASISIDTSAVPIPATATAPLPAGSIAAGTFANDAITAAVIANDAIDATALANGAITSAKFAANPLPTSLLPVVRAIEKSDGTPTNPTDDLFTITGGPIMVVEFVGIVTTPIGAGASTCTIQITTTDPAGTVSLSTAVDLDGDAAGTSYTFTAAAPGVLTPTTAGALAAVPQARWLCPIGTIKVAQSVTRAGNIKFYMLFVPLSPLSVVAAAA